MVNDMTIVELVGLALLFFSIIYSGRQIGLYIRMRKRMGKLLCALSPSDGQKKILIGAGLIFIVLLVMVTYSYVSKGQVLGAMYSALVAVVIYSTGRFTSKIVELREEGLLGHLNEIGYKEIGSYKIEERKSRGSITFSFKDGRAFVSLISLSAIDQIREVLKKKL